MDFENTGVFDAQTDDFEQEPQNDAAFSLSREPASSQVNNYSDNIDSSLARLSGDFAVDDTYARAANIENGLTIDPIKYGKAKRIAERRGADVDLVFDNFEEFEARDKQLLLDDIVKKNPALKELATDSPEFMKLAANDCDKLQEISNNLTIYGTMDAPIKPIAAVKKAAYLYNENERRLDVFEEIGDLMTKEDAESQARLAVLVDEANKASLIDTSGLSDIGYNAVEQLPYMKRTMLPVVGGMFTGAAIDAAVSAKIGAAGGAAAGSVVPGAGTAGGATIGAVGGAITGTIKGAVVGAGAGKLVAFKNTYDVETGSMYANLAVMKDENGQGFAKDDMIVMCRAYGVLSGVIELGDVTLMTRLIPGYNEAKKGLLKAGFKKAVQEALKNKTKIQAIRKILRDVSLSAGYEGLEESAQELLQVIGERYLQDKYNDLPGYDFEKNAWGDDISRVAEAGYQGTKASLLFPMLGGAGRAYTETRAINEMRAIDSLQRGDEAKAELDNARMDNIQNTIQQLGELKENPEQVQAFLQRATRKSDIRDIYMSVEDAKLVLQSDAVKKNMDVMKKLGVLDSIERQIANQQEIGGAVKIAFADYGATVMSRQELYAAFKDIVKTYEDGLTMNELRQHQKTIESVVKEGQKLKEQNKADFDYIYERILENARVAGIPSEQARAAAEGNAYFYLGLARLHNLSAVQMFQQNELNFDYKIENSPARSAQLDKIIDVIRDEQIKGADQNLLRASRIVARKDINAIKKTLMSKIDNPNTADVKEYLRLLNAISDMKLNLEGMTNEDFAGQLQAYAAQSPVTVDIRRSDADRVRSGMFSASEKALADIQAQGIGGDYVFVGGGRIPVNYEVVELTDLITSHNTDGAVNEAYPQELQPRDRSRSASDAQIAEIVNNFAPERVAKAQTATEGAPIITKEGFVAVGNGRAMAISKVYENAEKAEQYRKYLTEQGYNVDNFAEPVLVRRLAIDLDSEQLQALVDDANTAGTMQYSDAEKAIAYSKKLKGEVIDLLDTDAELESTANRRFIREFFATVVPTAERNAFLDKDDKVTRKGIEMIENTLTAIIVPDARFLSVLVENPDNNIRKVTSGLAKSAPAIVAFENDIQSGLVDAKYSVAADIRQAVEVLKRAKDKGQDLDLYVKQLDLLEGHIPAEVLAVADLFDKSRSAVDFADKIKSYIRNASEQGDLTQANMFGIEPVSKIELLERMNARSGLFQLPAGRKIYSVFDLKVGDHTAIGDVQEIDNENKTIKINDKLHSMILLDSQIQYKGLSVIDKHQNLDTFTQNNIDNTAENNIKKVSEYRSAVEYQKPRNAEYNKKAKDYFGITNNLNLGGYILTDGNILDLSGKKLGSDGRSRAIDHREISDAFDDNGVSMEDFINSGNIRYMPESYNLLMSDVPTTKQYKVIERIFEKANGEIRIELMSDANNWGSDKDFSREYSAGTDFSTVKRDINAFYRGEGIREIMQYFQSALPVRVNAKVTKLQEAIDEWEKYLHDVIEPNKYEWSKETLEDNRKNAKRKITALKKEIKKEEEKASVPVGEKLYATHNMSLAGVKGALALGGMAMPSLALRKVSQGNINQFGDIVFVANEKMVEPSRTTEIFDRDAWTPSIANSMRYALKNEGRQFINNILKRNDQENRASSFIYNIEEYLDTPKSNDMAIELYGMDKGIEIDPYETLHSQEYLDWYDKNIMGNSEPYLWTENASNTDMVAKKFTLENIMKILKKQENSGGGFIGDQVFSVRNLLNFMAKKYKNLDEVRKDKHKLASPEEQTAVIQKMDERFWELAEELRINGKEYSDGSDRMGLAIAAINAASGDEVIKKRLAGYFLDTSDEAVAKVKAFADMMKDVLTDYFEVKPRRVVDFSEFSGVIIPADKEYDEVAKRLEKEHFVTVERVKKGDVADYERALMNIQANAETTFFQNQNIDAEVLGSFTPSTLTITLFKNANLSTIIHESGHFWREMIRKYAAMDGASEQLKNYSETLENWLNSEWSKHNEVVVQPDGSFTLFYNGEAIQTGFASREAAIEVAKHECFARAIEKYFMTAEAPSYGLRKIFSTFKRWLLGVYKDAKELNVDITPEVKDVFDRLLASDGEIEQYVLEKRIRQMFDAPDKAKMSQKQFDRYKEYMDNMLTIAKDDYYKSLAAMAFKEKTAEFESKKADLRHDVLMQFSDTPENRFVIALVYGKIGDADIDIKANTAEIEATFNRVVPDGASRLPKRADGSTIFADDGMTFKELSEFFGLDTDVIKKTISQSPRLITAIEDTLRYQVHENLGSPVSYAEVEAQIVKSLHNDKYFDMLSLELSKLSPNPENQGAMEHALQARAEDIIGSLKITDIKPERYFNLSLKAGDNAIAALNRGNRNAAYTYKRQQLMNFFLYREAQKQLDFVDKAVRRLKQIGKKEVNPSVNQQHQDAARALLSRYSLANVLSQKQKERLGNLTRWIDEQRAAGYDIEVPTSILEAIDKKPYTDMSVNELAALNDVVKNIIHNGREIKTYELAGLQLEKEKLLEEMATQLKASYQPREKEKTGKQKKHIFRDFANTVDENLITLGGLCNRIDNGNANGVMHKAFLRPLTEAQNIENDLLRRFGDKMNELNNSLSEETKAALFENVPGAKEALGADFTLGELISVGLNMGNYYNKQRMRSNFGDNRQFEQKLGWVARTLTQEHWDYIQGVWDLLDSMYPMLAEHQKKMSGLDMDQVLATPVITPYGTYRGGYYPIVYDKTASMEARDKNDAETALLESDYGRATTAKGYTKARLDRVNAPLKFGLATISQHIASVIHDVAYRQTIRQLWNLANSPSFMEMFDTYLESEYRDGLCQLLKSLANQPNRDARAVKKLDGYLRIIRNRTTTIGLAYRVTTAVAQTLGFFTSVAALNQRGRKNGGKRSGKYWLWRGIKAFAQSSENREWALANSGELRTRLNNNDVNIAEAMRGVAVEISRKQKIEAGFIRGGFWLIGKMDFMVAQSTWFAAYLQATQDFGYEHKDAVFYADRIMIDSQGTGNLKDTPLFQRSSELSRSLAMFYSPFAGLYQIWTQSAKDIKDKRQFAGAISDLFTALILPPLVEGILKGENPGADDDFAEWIKYFLLNPLFYWLSSIPIARDAASVMDFGRVPGSLYANAFNTVFQPIKKIYKMADGKDVKGNSFVKDLMNAAAMTTGIPIGGQIADWASWSTGIMTGEVKAESPADILYGIYRGKERK